MKCGENYGKIEYVSWWHLADIISIVGLIKWISGNFQLDDNDSGGDSGDGDDDDDDCGGGVGVGGGGGEDDDDDVRSDD